MGWRLGLTPFVFGGSGDYHIIRTDVRVGLCAGPGGVSAGANEDYLWMVNHPRLGAATDWT